MTGKLKRLVLELTNSDLTLLSQIHHGLNETPLLEFFQVLDLDEALVFELGSWIIRNEEHEEFRRLFLDESVYSATGLYGVFNYLLHSRLGGGRLNNARRKISEDLISLNHSLNQFRNLRDISLAQRLSTISIEAEEKLISQLTYPTKRYAWEHDPRRTQETGDIIIPFSVSKSPSREDLVLGYAKSIADTIGGYLELYEQEKMHLQAHKLVEVV